LDFSNIKEIFGWIMNISNRKVKKLGSKIDLGGVRAHRVEYFLKKYMFQKFPEPFLWFSQKVQKLGKNPR
jgi:hypothetical protein